MQKTITHSAKPSRHKQMKMLYLLQKSLNTLEEGIEAFDAVRNANGEIIDFEYTYARSLTIIGRSI